MLRNRAARWLEVRWSLRPPTRWRMGQSFRSLQGRLRYPAPRGRSGGPRETPKANAGREPPRARRPSSGSGRESQASAVVAARRGRGLGRGRGRRLGRGGVHLVEQGLGFVLGRGGGLGRIVLGLRLQLLVALLELHRGVRRPRLDALRLRLAAAGEEGEADEGEGESAHPLSISQAHREGKGGEVLLPGPPRAAGVRFCCPVRPDRAFVLSNSTREGQVTRQSRGPRYRWHLCDGPLRWSHSGRKLRFSTHVDPGSAPSAEPLGRHASCVLPEWLGPSGGAAGYCPRVRCAYDTQHFIAIAGQAGPTHIGGS